MSAFAISTCIASLAIFAGWLALSIHKFGWLSSYSAYAAKWNEALKINGAHIWSIVTVVVAILLAFSTIEAGDESPLQFLGFFAPIYLIVVALTPEYEEKPNQRIIHNVGATLCVICTILWLVFALRVWYSLPIAIALCGLAAYLTKTLKSSYGLWLEIAVFVAVYGTVLIGGLVR